MRNKEGFNFKNIDHSYNECIQSLEYITTHYFDKEFGEYNRRVRLLYNDLNATINYMQNFINNSFTRDHPIKVWFKQRRKTFREENSIIEKNFKKIRIKGQHHEMLTHYETVEVDKLNAIDVCSCVLSQTREILPPISKIKRIISRTIKGFNNRDIRVIFDEILKELQIYINDCKAEINKYKNN